MHGLTVDHLTGVDKVVCRDRRAEVLQGVSAAHYPDLFWAVRGGGQGSFGIIRISDRIPSVQATIQKCYYKSSTKAGVETKLLAPSLESLFQNSGQRRHRVGLDTTVR